MDNLNFITRLENYFSQSAKTRAIQAIQEKKLLEILVELRRSFQSAADTVEERSGSSAWP